MYTISTEDGSKDNIYVNVVINGSIPNYNPTGPGTPNIANPPTGEQDTLAEYKVTKTVPFIDNPADYYCSMVRFVVPLRAVPLFIMPIIPNTYVSPTNPGDPNISTLILGINYNGINYSQYVPYIPNNGNTAPIQNQTTQIITPYYYVYVYSELITMLNTTLDLLWVISGLAAAYPSLNAPILDFDSTNELVNIIVPFIFTTTFEIATIYMNNETLKYLDSFQIKYIGPNQPYGFDCSFIFPDEPSYYYPYPGVPNPSPPPNSTYYNYFQDYNVLYYWSSLKGLIFTSQTLPIANEVVPSNTGSGVYTSLPIITDYVLDVNSAGQSRSIAVYNPTSQYRLISLSGNAPINSIDIKIFWRDQIGNLYPLYLSQNQQVSIKIGFFKKSLYNNTINTRK
jgi:hypothetical protein